MPVVLGGRSFFAGNGFSEEPKDASAYADALACGPQLTLNTEQRERALIANDLFYRRLIVDCRFLPDTPYNFWKPFDEGALWRGYVDAMESGSVEDDAVYSSMTTALESDSDTFLRPL